MQEKKKEFISWIFEKYRIVHEQPANAIKNEDKVIWTKVYWAWMQMEIQDTQWQNTQKAPTHRGWAKESATEREPWIVEEEKLKVSMDRTEDQKGKKLELKMNGHTTIHRIRTDERCTSLTKIILTNINRLFCFLNFFLSPFCANKQRHLFCCSVVLCSYFCCQYYWSRCCCCCCYCYCCCWAENNTIPALNFHLFFIYHICSGAFFPSYFIHLLFSIIWSVCGERGLFVC